MATSPVPDLRVDFFTESVDNTKKRHSYVEITMKQMTASFTDISPNLSNTNTSSAMNATGINVTSNPMDETTTTVTCTTQTPRATIVVQQVIEHIFDSSMSCIHLTQVGSIRKPE